MRRQAPRFQADDISDIDTGDQFATAGEIAGGENLEIVRRGVAGDSQVLLFLADDLVADGAGEAITAEAADREIIAVVDEAGHGVFDGHQLIGLAHGLVRKNSRARLADGSA